jgi:putative ABC transport system ATP-binding protein
MSRREIVHVHDLRKVYYLGSQEVHALRVIDLTLFAGEYVSIMGPSGSGKSTFFNMIGGLDRPTLGEVYIDEVDIVQLDVFELAWLRRRKIGYIFQTFNLIPVMNAVENVSLPMIFAGTDMDEARDKAVQLLERVGLGGRLHHRPTEMSGGQRQRLAIARALANDPAIILADEPTGNLDLGTGREIIDLLKELNAEKNVTVITATHDMKMLAASDRVIWITDGAISRIQSREELDIQVGRIDGMEE